MGLDVQRCYRVAVSGCRNLDRDKGGIARTVPGTRGAGGADFLSVHHPFDVAVATPVVPFHGAVAAIEYVALTAWTFSRYPVGGEDTSLFSFPVYLTYGMMLLIAGFVAGEVARQIRGHVVATLREAEGRARIDQDLEIARSIQQGLLPTGQLATPGYDIAGWNRPADQTGGDFFDWQELSDGRFAVTLADVTGHGVGRPWWPPPAGPTRGPTCRLVPTWERR